MGSRGSGGISGAVAHFFVGSVTDYMVKHAPCPVLVIKDDEHVAHVSAARGSRSAADEAAADDEEEDE